jgi:LPXTG-site transpeptidase (sortase) family protein
MPRWPEVTLIAAGLLLVAASVVVTLDRDDWQSAESRTLDRDLARVRAAVAVAHVTPVTRAAPAPAVTPESAASSSAPVTPPNAATRPRVRHAIGRLEIPRIALTVMIGEGVGRHTLDRAVGHVPGSAQPGRPGNVALAGHRDTFFRRLGQLGRGDRIRIATAARTYEYRVISTTVVGPERADYQDPTTAPMLTLITCYPFDAIGPAPQRFVVRALEMGDVADDAPARVR